MRRTRNYEHGIVYLERPFRPIFLLLLMTVYLLLLFSLGVLFALYYLLFRSPMTDNVWRGTGSLGAKILTFDCVSNFAHCSKVLLTNHKMTEYTHPAHDEFPHITASSSRVSHIPGYNNQEVHYLNISLSSVSKDVVKSSEY